MDGYGDPEAHIQRAAELGMSALALTEHGNVSSHVRLEKAGQKLGVKPIFGIELYTGAVGEGTRGKYKWHLTVLAENEIGYRNLLRLTSRGWAEGFYYEPTVSGEMLADHAEGLIVLSGCSGSKLVCDLLGGKGIPEHDRDFQSALSTAQRFQDLLGDRYYLEAQAFPELDRTCQTNQALEKISVSTGIKIVATGDVHYPKPSDSDMQVILHAAGRGNKTFESQQQSWGYDIKLSPPLSDKAVVDRLVRTGLSRGAALKAVGNAATIGERCNVTLPKAERMRYPVPDGGSSASLFRRWIVAGWKYRGFDKLPDSDKAKYKERLRYEMQTIEAKDFIDYFLLLSDTVRFAKDSGIPVGPGRGSAAASLLCYVLRITEIDPLQFPHMLFERFMDVTRVDPPDIDLDFADDRRDEVRQYLIRKYGEGRVGNIGNFVRYRGKNSINDVARVYRIPKWASDQVNDLVIERSSGDSRFGSSLADTEEMFPAAKKIFDQFPDLRQAFRLEGNMRGMSVHAAGLVVGNTPLTDICAVYTKKSGKEGRVLQVLSLDKYDAEHLGVLKIDALGLKTMGMIAIALDLAGITLEELYAIGLEDPKTLAGFKNSDLVGIFQFEGRATRLVCRDVSPDNFSEIADVTSLSRPGPLFSGVTATYTAVKHGRADAEVMHPALTQFLDFTKGQIIYQEQILNIIKEVGGFPVTKLAGIRRIISRKLGEGQFQKMYDAFVIGAKERYDIGPELAWKIWSKMVTSAQYSFNIPHAVSYGKISYWTMWLKVHHPEAFYVASLIKSKDSTTVPGKGKGNDSLMKLLRDAQTHGIDVRSPDLRLSGKTWAVSEVEGKRVVVAGFEQIPGIGEKMAEEIISSRDEGTARLDGWNDLICVKGIGPAKLKGILEFVESSDPFGLDRTKRMLEAVWEAAKAGEVRVPTPTHTSDDIDPQDEIQRVVWWGVVRHVEHKDLLEDERAKTGLEPEEIRARVKDPDKSKSCTLHCSDPGTEDVYLRFNRWHFPKFKKQIEAIRPHVDVVVAVGRKRKGFGVSLQVERLYIVDPEV